MYKLHESTSPPGKYGMNRLLITEDELKSKIYAEFIRRKIEVLPIQNGLQVDEIRHNKCNWQINWDRNVILPPEQDRESVDDSIKNLQSQFNVS